MASITIRRLDDRIKAKLRLQAASHGRSMEEEAREILKSGLRAQPVSKLGLGAAIRSYVEPLGGIDLVIPKREAIRPPPKFDR